MRRILSAALVLCVATGTFAGKVAIFPAQSVNADKSFCDAFGVLLASKYASHSKEEVISPLKTAPFVSPDKTLPQSAQELGVSEYIELEAVGLYLSRAEKAEAKTIDAEGSSKTIIVKLHDDDEDKEKSDQQLLDNHKTIVTATRRTTDGSRVHSVEMTLVTYGDIEESTDRIAEALFKKVSVNEVLALHNITRKEGMGQNKLFIENQKGIRTGFIYPVAANAELSPLITIGYNHRMDSEKFFLEFGINGRFPSASNREKDRFYGGMGIQIGGGYYLINSNNLGLWAGLAMGPTLNIGDNLDLKVGALPSFHAGVSFPRTSKIQGYIGLRVAQNLVKIATGGSYYDDSYNMYYNDTESLPYQEHLPTEFGLEMGIGF